MKGSYGFVKNVEMSFAEAVAKTTEELRKEGFGVLTEIDMKAKFKEKLNIDFRNYLILGACNPSLAQEALHEDLNLGLLLPCNIVVYEAEKGSVVAAIDAKRMMSVVENEKLEKVARIVNEKLKRVIENI